MRIYKLPLDSGNRQFKFEVSVVSIVSVGVKCTVADLVGKSVAVDSDVTLGVGARVWVEIGRVCDVAVGTSAGRTAHEVKRNNIQTKNNFLKIITPHLK